MHDKQEKLRLLEPLLDPQFSASSYGFRPKRSAHDALRQAAKHVRPHFLYRLHICQC